MKMESKQIDQLLMVNASKLPPEGVALLRERLMNVDDPVSAQVAFSQLKDPTIALILSILVGAYGIDRFYIGDIGLGMLKLITCGGALVWFIIDIFLIMDTTRHKNLETLLLQLN